MASNTDFYDVIIIGTGAGGGSSPYRPSSAPSGERILLLERSNFLPRGNREL